jgi:anthranilate synthase component II
MVLIIDNYDSFTYNVAQYFAELGVGVKVFKNDELSIDQIYSMQPRHIVISPGPCTPDDAGVCLDVVSALARFVPILGICLGHQCIAQALGGRVVRAKQVVHGKTSQIHHGSTDIFDDLPNPFTATRYHSLVVDATQIPTDLRVTAWTQGADGRVDEIMGIAHTSLPLVGVQFHPESILSEYGHRLFHNFLNL